MCKKEGFSQDYNNWYICGDLVIFMWLRVTDSYIVFNIAWTKCNLNHFWSTFRTCFLKNQWTDQGPWPFYFFRKTILSYFTFYAIFWEYKAIISHLMFSSCFFCMLEILENVVGIFYEFLGPLDLLPWRVVGRSVGPSVNTCNSATNFRIFFKIGGNIPWVNISRSFFRFCKILNFEFLKNKFQF